MPDETKRKRRHLANLDIRISEERDQRFDAVDEPDATDGERGAAANASLGIGKQPAQI